MFNIFLRGQLWTIPVFVLVKHGKSLFSSWVKSELRLMFFLGEICCQLHLLYPSAHEIKIIMFHWPIKPLCFKRKTEKFDCVWYHLYINAQHSSNPCEQMELCRSVTWFCKTAESSMPHLKFCLVCWLEKPLMTTTNKYKNLLWSVGNVKASPEWEKNWKFCC